MAACTPAPPEETRTEFTALQRGEVSIRCRDGDEYPRRSITDITPLGLESALADCDPSELVLFYEGEIDPSFAQMITLIAARQWPYDRRSMFIHSAGGDVEAALRAGEVIAREPWGVFVARTGEISLNGGQSSAKCYSACVIVLAAAHQRIIQGEVGIHRIYPSGSDATSRDALATELESIVERTKAFMRLNGVSTTIVDDMMSVPSSDIRVLTPDQINDYGLGRDNAAQSDLERLDLERRCGTDFVARLRSAEAAIDQVCAPRLRAACDLGSTSCTEANAAMDACSNDINREYGFPDSTCPSDGPYFFCTNGRIAEDCENSN